MGKPVSKVSDVRVPGPLAPFAAEFKAALLDVGYTPLSAVNQLRLMVHLSRWLDDRGLSAAGLTEERVEEYLLTRRAGGYVGLYARRGLVPLLDFLAAQQVRPVQKPAPRDSAVEVLLASFERYLLTERALAASTISAYVVRATRFVADYTVDGDVSMLTAADVTRAVLDECSRVSVGAVQYFVAALRSFLRFCRVEGLLGVDLSAAALAVTGRRSSLLPKGITDREAKALLRSCDRRRATGRRDYAVLVVLLRLGLRAGEVAALELENIDWRAGQVVVHGKGQRADRLPLPADVGEAVVGYLQRGRPTTSRREVFVTATAPLSRLTRESVSSIVRRACVRAGVIPVGAHRLRHTMAGAMVRAGVPLPEIGQVLRHRGQVSTAVYSRVDITQLRDLARPWPAGEQR
jgi:site-specific recombinase XerD